jgi:hypothetical protein
LSEIDAIMCAAAMLLSESPVPAPSFLLPVLAEKERRTRVGGVAIGGEGEPQRYREDERWLLNLYATGKLPITIFWNCDKWATSFIVVFHLETYSSAKAVDSAV